MKNDIIKEHYSQLAHACGSSKDMSMEDNFTKESEIQTIITVLNYFNNSSNILELGCGNGYTAHQIFSRCRNFNYAGIDYCEDLIKLSKDRNIPDYNFVVGNVLDLGFKNESFDIVFSERCLINLESWENQKRSLSEVFRVLKKGGIYLMIEGFTDGLNNLNEARRVVGLEPVQQKFFNTYFVKEYLMHYIKNKFIIYEDPNIVQPNFLSTYYFGRSVLYPAVSINKKLEYNNKFVEFFSYLQPYGNYSYIQAFIFRKV